ncbi:MAG: hypothetical protein EXS05_09505 [Planctomycetaceae bacterium]|nr:hypothetical protein [Planctomycetaceae bacterium]
MNSSLDHTATRGMRETWNGVLLLADDIAVLAAIVGMAHRPKASGSSDNVTTSQCERGNTKAYTARRLVNDHALDALNTMSRGMLPRTKRRTSSCAFGSDFEILSSTASWHGASNSMPINSPL